MTTAEVSYYGKRYYAPDSGRWISRDPLFETGSACTASAFVPSTAAERQGSVRAPGSQPWHLAHLGTQGHGRRRAVVCTGGVSHGFSAEMDNLYRFLLNSPPNNVDVLGQKGLIGRFLDKCKKWFLGKTQEKAEEEAKEWLLDAMLEEGKKACEDLKKPHRPDNRYGLCNLCSYYKCAGEPSAVQFKKCHEATTLKCMAGIDP